MPKSSVLNLGASIFFLIVQLSMAPCKPTGGRYDDGSSGRPAQLDDVIILSLSESSD